MNTNTALQINGTYTDLVREQYVKEKDSTYKIEAKYLGATTAIHDTLRPDTPIRVVCGPITANYNALIAHCHRHNEGLLSIAQGKIQIEALLSENEVLLKEIEQGQSRLDIEKYKTGKIIVPTVPYRQLIIALAIGAILLLTESLLLGSSFAVLGMGLAANLVIGLGITLAITLISVFASSYAEKASNKRTRLFILLGLGCIVTACVWVLAEMRSLFYKSTGQDINAAKLALLTLLTYIASHFLYSHLISPAFQRMKARREAKDKLSVIAKMEKKLQALKQAYTTNLDRINQVKQFRLAVLAFSKSLEINITRMYYQAIEIFKQSYTEQRGFIHPSFGGQPDDLSRFYDEINITTTITHERAE